MNINYYFMYLEDGQLAQRRFVLSLNPTNKLTRA